MFWRCQRPALVKLYLKECSNAWNSNKTSSSRNYLKKVLNILESKERQVHMDSWDDEYLLSARLVTKSPLVWLAIDIGQLLSQAPTSPYKTPPNVLQRGLQRAQFPDGQSKITEKIVWLLHIYRSDLRVICMTGLITTTDARRGVENLKFESLSRIRDSAIVNWTFSSFRWLVSKPRHCITRWK